MSLMSNHASVRQRSRSISKFAVDLILTYGSEVQCAGAVRHFLNKNDRRNIKRELGDLVYKRIQDLLDICVVEGDDGKVVTVFHRTKRIKMRN